MIHGLLVGALVLLLAACGNGGGGRAITAKGTIRAQEMTSYQYGTHVLVDDAGRTLYALRSADPRLLDANVGKRVQVTGTDVPGYPVDGGPEYLDVASVQVAGP